jgi:hypothetical protein
MMLRFFGRQHTFFLHHVHHGLVFGQERELRYLRQRGRPRCLGFRTVHVRFRSHGSSVLRLLS